MAFLSSEARRRGYELDLLREIDRKHLGRVRAVVRPPAKAKRTSQPWRTIAFHSTAPPTSPITTAPSST